jgi:ribonuclease Y
MTGATILLVLLTVLLVAFGLTATVMYLREKARRESLSKTVEADAKRAIEQATAEAETLRKSAEVEAKETIFKARAEAESATRDKRQELQRKQEQLAKDEASLTKKNNGLSARDQDLVRREKSIAGREQAADSATKQAEKALDDARQRLEQIAGLSAEQARERLAMEMLDEARKTAAAEIHRIEAETREEAEARAKRIIGTAIQRYAGEYVTERTVSVVPLPSDDMKGRIIGREGRNIRALEAATGIDLIIDDTPEAVIISCFNPVRREIARLALGRLISDGRIHPTRIEEVVAKCTQEVEQAAKEAGEQAIFDLGLNRMHPELVGTLGKLKYRASYAQNLLAHSVEVGFLAGIMAAELNLNVKLARRAGLLHDIGKGVDQEVEGSHAQVGAALARRLGESPKICKAIAAHHEEEPPDTVLDQIVDAANRLSGQRPGARRELLQTYVQRLSDIEKLCSSYPGVSGAYAIQAGREVRVMVENSAVTDDQAIFLSKDIARRIEQEMTYPGQIRVCVIRETRATDYAK